MLPTPRAVLLKLHALGLPGKALLESAGEVTPFGRYSLLSAAPTVTRRSLPELPPQGADFFPAWIGGLTYEGEHFWGYYPSGLVWDHSQGTLEPVGEEHLDWQAVLAAPEATLEVPVVGTLESDFPREAFEKGVLEVQNLILAGECYQVNLSHRLHARYHGEPLYAYCTLAGVNPSPFMAYLELEGCTVASSSPERLVLWQPGLEHGDTLAARPIAGTRRRGDSDAEDAALERELLEDPKERAEHVMLLDLARNDLGRIAEAGSVWVSEFFTVERYSHVMHLVSEVRARARSTLTLPQLLEATFPGGTITGAPKARVMQAIRALEPTPRGWYTGSVGFLSGRGVDLNILIRTLAFWNEKEEKEERDGSPESPLPSPEKPVYTVHLSSGAGIVIDSDPAREYLETRNKAAALVSVLSPSSAARPPRPPRPPVYGSSWTPTSPLLPPNAFLRVLLLDNFDSFTYNIAQDLEALGAKVEVRSNQTPLAELTELLEGGHALLIGPGPGTPMTSGVTLELAQYALERHIPTLGVCLGHQALGELLGARLLRAPYPVHGKLEQVTHSAQGLFEGLPATVGFTRYHSLIVRDLPSETARAIARSAGGELMALEALHAPAWGVQFHPESVLSEGGRRLLSNWIRLARAVQQEVQA